MKINSKAQSKIIVLVLVILLVLGSIVIVFNFVIPFIKESSQKSDAQLLTTHLDIKSAKLKGETTMIEVHRPSGDSKLDALDFIFNTDKGSHHLKITENLPELGTVKYYFNSSFIGGITQHEEIKSIKVIPIANDKFGAPSNDKSVDDQRNLLNNPGAETGNLTGWASLSGISSENHSGAYSFQKGGYGVIITSELIKIDPNRKYYQEGWFKSPKNSRLYYGYITYDKNGRTILPQNILHRSGTETTLYEAISSSDEIIKITDGSGWSTSHSYYVIAFDIDDSGNYNDIPNFDISNRNIIRIENKGPYWEVEFLTSVGKTYPAGTKIREHYYSSTYMYNSASSEYVPNEWTKYSSVIEGESPTGETSGMWRKGSRYIRAMMLTNYGGNINNITYIDDLVFRFA